MAKDETATRTRPSEPAGDGTWTTEDELAQRRKETQATKFGVGQEVDFAALKTQGVSVLEELGEPRLIEDKAELVNTPFAVMNWVFNPGDFANPDGSNRPFVSVYIIIEKGNERAVLNDGSTGIMMQLAGRKRPIDGGRVLLCKGLKESNFLTDPITGEAVGKRVKWDDYVKKTYPGKDIQPIESQTYYLN